MSAQIGADRIDVVGGVYREACMRPGWKEVFGSAGRAAVAMATMGSKCRLHTYLDAVTKDLMAARASLDDIELQGTDIASSGIFDYTHCLSTPRIFAPAGPIEPITVRGQQVVRFGMLEQEAVVHADQAVYDPQNAHKPVRFQDNGSTARQLALVLNRHEASLMTGMPDAPVSAMAEALITADQAQVVVIKQGPLGAHVREGARSENVPAFKSGTVWKLGSGDNFVGHFAHHWMNQGRTAAESAMLASQATAYYCGTRGFATGTNLASFKMPAIRPSAQFVAGRKPRVYLAGPFFSLAQVWLVEEARQALLSMGLHVFSPYHDVGHASAADVATKDLAAIREADILFAISDGLDSGTMYEIGYANSLGKPVVMYCENESERNLKMMNGAGCLVCGDFVSAIYNTAWMACEL